MGNKSPEIILAPGSGDLHQLLVNQILLALNPFGRFWSNKTGAATTSSGRFIRFGLPGSPDIIGVQKNTGKFIGIEVKTGKAVQSNIQKNFQKMITDMGGLYFVCRSVEDALENLKNLERPIIH